MTSHRYSNDHGGCRCRRQVATTAFFLVLLTLILLANPGLACIHDQLSHSVVSNVQVYAEDHPFLLSQRRQRRLVEKHKDRRGLQVGEQEYDRVEGQAVDDDAFRPLRITPYYDDQTLNDLPSDKQATIERMVSDAIHRFQRTLRVVPVHRNLTAQRSCAVQWSTTPVVCKTVVEQERCLEMPMPIEHFAPIQICSTCISSGCRYGQCTTVPPPGGASGVIDSDFVLYVRAAHSAYCMGERKLTSESDSESSSDYYSGRDAGAVLAYASSCQKDQFDRPTFGMVNFCPQQMDSNPLEYDRQLATAMHELTHALGFSASLFAFMRHADGTPRTPPASANDIVAPHNPLHPFVMTRPGNTTIAFANERGTRVARLVTPRVAAFVQSHFGCPSLRGAELESQDESGMDFAIGSHWEARIFEPEYMTAVSSLRNVFSALTLAFFEDSGWYRANLEIKTAVNSDDGDEDGAAKKNPLIHRLHFGQSRGCAFATEPCIHRLTGQSVAEDHFCTSTGDIESCSVDATSRSVCAVSAGIPQIPAPYQYFVDPTRGGTNAYADYCPLNSAFAAGDCTNPDNLVMPTGTTLNILGERYGATSRCTTTTLRSVDSSRWIVHARRQTGCYEMRCIVGDDGIRALGASGMIVELLIPAVPDQYPTREMEKGDEEEEERGGREGLQRIRCTAMGTLMSVPGYTGVITCPDPDVVCDRLCPSACSGNGVCESATTTCTCDNGWTGRDCSTPSHTTTAATEDAKVKAAHSSAASERMHHRVRGQFNQLYRIPPWILVVAIGCTTLVLLYE